MVLLTALLVPMFALALQSEKRAELANEKSILFSQEMASSSSHSNNDIPLATLLEWYKIRDTFFGGNFVIQNIPCPLRLPHLASIPTLAGSLRRAQERM
jgi:hypothetical protein